MGNSDAATVMPSFEETMVRRFIIRLCAHAHNRPSALHLGKLIPSRLHLYTFDPHARRSCE
jgi:hypothetical protein